MTALFILFIISLLFGQLGGMTFGNGAVVYIHDIALIFLLLGVLYESYRCGRFVRPKLMLPVAGFVAVAILSLLLNIPRFGLDRIVSSSLYLVRWILYSMLYVALVQKHVTIPTVLNGLYSFGALLAGLGFAQLFLFPDLRAWTYLGWDPHRFRLFSTLLDPNFTGLLLTLTFLLGSYLWQKSKNSIVLFLEFMLIIAIYLTYSRSSYLALCAGVIALIVAYKKWYMLVAVTVFLMAVILLPTPGGKTLRLDRIDSSVSRFTNWQETMNTISTSPLYGYGFNTLKYVRNTDAPEKNLTVTRASTGVDSSLLYVLATTGIAGLSVAVWGIGTFLSNGGKTTKHVQFRTMIIAMSLAAFSHSFFSNSLFYAWVMLFGWMLVASDEIISDM